MFLDQAGELIVDVLTANRSLASIPSASAILDTSNYTLHAVSFGKDADGFKYHAHEILSPSSDGVIKVTSYGDASVSNYHASSTISALEFYYKQLPQSPTPIDTRLESKSTIPNYSSGVVDIGHCLNPSINPQLSAYTHLIGCFPASGGTDYVVRDTEGNQIFSGVVSSIFNQKELMDSSGFLTFYQGSLTNHEYLYSVYEPFSGVLRIKGSNFPEDIDIKIFIRGGDVGSLILFGGLYHIGLWYLDLKEMLKEGYYPPYSFNPLNNIRKYKLFAKKTFNKNLLEITPDTAAGLVLFKILAEYIDYGPEITWKLRFV